MYRYICKIKDNNAYEYYYFVFSKEYLNTEYIIKSLKFEYFRIYDNIDI